ncbi:MAG: MerR family transcriptional regulator [Gemmatimonadales bacterium]|nr:MerR family transcriptional regulator [Gemmatimonadales bacterium]
MPGKQGGQTIGEIAAESRVNIQTVRYYERRGLLPTPQRTAAGYRKYSRDVVARIRFIKRAQELGFTLGEIAELLALRVRHSEACGEVSRRATVKIAVVQRKLRELERLKRALERLVEACRRRAPTAECPILEALEEPEEHA